MCVCVLCLDARRRDYVESSSCDDDDGRDDDDETVVHKKGDDGVAPFCECNQARWRRGKRHLAGPIEGVEWLGEKKNAHPYKYLFINVSGWKRRPQKPPRRGPCGRSRMLVWGRRTSVRVLRLGTSQSRGGNELVFCRTTGTLFSVRLCSLRF